MPTVSDFIERAKKDGLLSNNDVVKNILEQVELNRQISTALEDLLRKTLREANVREIGVHITASIIISAINNRK